jgi:hypothetical protein
MADFLTWDATDRESLYRRTVQVSADLVDSHVPYEARLVTMGTLIVAIAKRIRTIAKHSEIAVVFVVCTCTPSFDEFLKLHPENNEDFWGKYVAIVQCVLKIIIFETLISVGMKRLETMWSHLGSTFTTLSLKFVYSGLWINVPVSTLQY